MDPRVAPWRRWLRGPIADRDWICTGDIAQGAAGLARRLRSLGARRCLLVAGRLGTGPLDVHPDDELVLLGVEGTGMMEGIHKTEALLADLPDAARARIEAFDPEGVARVAGPLYAWSEEVAGRSLFGGRPASWRELEDKTTVDALWDAAGVVRAPRELVPAEPSALLEAHRRLDAGDGTVWVADNSQGWFGGADRLRWVQTDADAAEAATYLPSVAQLVRVMPFLEGVPCSIHGIVLPDAVLALRPCEMVVLRDARRRFHYARAATGWRPATPDTAHMRAFARRVGAHLRERVGYRGVFTVDGVLTRAGFRPTELNPRYGAALATLLQGTPEIASYLLHLAIADGVPLPAPAGDLEALLLDLSNTHRVARGLAHIHGREPAPRSFALVADGAGWRAARDGETPDVTGSIGPGATGGMVLFELAERVVPDGPPAAPVMAKVLRHLDAELDLGIGALHAAPSVR